MRKMKRMRQLLHKPPQQKEVRLTLKKMIKRRLHQQQRVVKELRLSLQPMRAIFQCQHQAWRP